MTKNNIPMNDLLREALQKKYAQEPRLAEDFAKRVSQKMAEKTKRVVPLWVKYASVAAAVVVAFMLGRWMPAADHEETLQTNRPNTAEEKMAAKIVHKTDTVYLDRQIAVEKTVVVHDTVRVNIPVRVAANDMPIASSSDDAPTLQMADMELMMNEFVESRRDIHYTSLERY